MQDTYSDAREARFGLRHPRQLWVLAAAVAVVALDQFTKWLIRSSLERGDSWPDGGLLRIVHVTNSGAAFGILQDSGPLLAITSILGVCAIFIYFMSPSFAKPLMQLGLGLMLGGAMGNLIDRLFKGEVVDFLKVPNWPAFNVADSSISIGVVLIIWTILFDETDEQAKSEPS